MNGIVTSTARGIAGYLTTLTRIPILSLLFVVLTIVLLLNLLESSVTKQSLPTVNRTFAWEPSFISRIRFAFNPHKILDDAYKKYNGKAYLIARGDADFVVLPAECVHELNRLDQNTINSRMCHAYSMVGNLNGMDIVLKSNLHVRALLNKLTPALPDLTRAFSVRIGKNMEAIFPHSTDSWTVVKPINGVVHCVSQTIALAALGQPICDNPRLIRLIFEHTQQVFTVMFAMRMLPAMLQPVFVWLLPQKWWLRSSTKELESFVIPQVNKYRKDMELEGHVQHTMMGWMVAEARQDIEKDPYFLTQLLAALSAGGSYSSANFIVSTLLDLIAHPQFLDEIREEIALKNLQINGNWDYQAFDDLPKLDSAFKETSRLAPGSLTTYSRVMLRDHTLSNGINLKKGQFICISSYCLSKDPSVYFKPDEYDALRQFNVNLEGHVAHPFKDLDNQEFRWGAGRWACAGRYLATLVAKIILVKMLDEYEFQFIDGKRPKNTFLYEFIFVDPGVKMKMRRRQCSHGIQYAGVTNS